MACFLCFFNTLEGWYETKSVRIADLLSNVWGVLNMWRASLVIVVVLVLVLILVVVAVIVIVIGMIGPADKSMVLGGGRKCFLGRLY